MATHIQLFAPAGESKPTSEMFGILHLLHRGKDKVNLWFLLTSNYSFYEKQQIPLSSPPLPPLNCLICFILSDPCLHETPQD